MPDYNDDPLHTTLRDNIESLIEEQEITWTSMGRAADLSTSMVTHIRHLKSTPSLVTLSKIADALDVSISELVDGC